MPRFVAFLRGINVGGHIVKKEQLLEAFAALGFDDAKTYKQSGNVIFEVSNADTEEIKVKIEQNLKFTLGFDVTVFIRTIEQLKTIVDSQPFKNQSKQGTSFLVTLLQTSLQAFPLLLPLTIPKSTAQIIGFEGSEVFSVTHGGGEGALPNPFVESRLKAKATTRNINVICAVVKKYSVD